MILPDPNNYSDGMAFFRDVHKLVLHSCAELERLLADAEVHGVFKSFATQPEWEELFRFFTVVAPEHERDEEQFLFPLVIARVPHVGFQQTDAPIRFLIEGHEVIERKLMQLLKDWDAFRTQQPNPAAIEESHTKHQAEDAAFIASGRDLARVYREHVTIEEQQVYSLADRVLSGDEKLGLIESLRISHGDEATTTLLDFDRPQFSDPSYNTAESTEAQGNVIFNFEDDDEDDDASDGAEL